MLLDVFPFEKNRKNHKDRMNQLNTRKDQRIKKGSQVSFKSKFESFGIGGGWEESFLSPRRIQWSS